MKTKISLLALVSLLVLFSACRKETNPNVHALKDFFSTNRVQSQFFTFNVNSYHRVVGAKNTIIWFWPGSLIDKNGNIVTGNVQVELKEIYSKGDMILSNATTTSNNVLLQSGGEIYLKATQNGQELRVNPSNPLFLEFPSANPTNGMQLFTGEFKKNETVAADSILNWSVVDSSAAVITDDSIGGNFSLYYSFTLDSFGWTNCDRFWNLAGGTDPMIHVPDGFDNTNTSVYMIFDIENAAALADDFANGIFRFHSGEHTPIGINVTIVAVAKKGDLYYYDIEHKVTSAGATFNLTMTEARHDVIVTAINAL